MIDKIVEYIRQNRNTYTHKAINQKLREEGYSQDDINAAWRFIEDTEMQRDPDTRKNARPAETPVIKRWSFWGVVALVVIVIYSCIYLSFAFARTDTTSSFALLFNIGLQIGLFVLSLINPTKHKIVPPGILVGMLFADIILPMIGGLIVLGICLSGGFRF